MRQERVQTGKRGWQPRSCAPSLSSTTLPLMPFLRPRRIISRKANPESPLSPTARYTAAMKKSLKEPLAQPKSTTASISSREPFPPPSERSAATWKKVEISDTYTSPFRAQDPTFELYLSRKESFWIVDVVEAIAFLEPSLLSGLFPGNKTEREALFREGLVRVCLWLPWEGGWHTVTTEAEVVLKVPCAVDSVHETPPTARSPGFKDASLATCLVERAVAKSLSSFAGLAAFSSRGCSSSQGWGLRIVAGLMVHERRSPSSPEGVRRVFFKSDRSRRERRKGWCREVTFISLLRSDEDPFPILAMLSDCKARPRELTAVLHWFEGGQDRQCEVSQSQFPSVCKAMFDTVVLPGSWRERTMLFREGLRRTPVFMRRQFRLTRRSDRTHASAVFLRVSIVGLEGPLPLCLAFKNGATGRITGDDVGIVYARCFGEEVFMDGDTILHQDGAVVSLLIDADSASESTVEEREGEDGTAFCLRLWSSEDVLITELPSVAEVSIPLEVPDGSGAVPTDGSTRLNNKQLLCAAQIEIETPLERAALVGQIPHNHVLCVAVKQGNSRIFDISGCQLLRTIAEGPCYVPLPFRSSGRSRTPSTNACKSIAQGTEQNSYVIACLLVRKHLDYSARGSPCRTFRQNHPEHLSEQVCAQLSFVSEGIVSIREFPRLHMQSTSVAIDGTQCSYSVGVLRPAVSPPEIPSLDTTRCVDEIWALLSTAHNMPGGEKTRHQRPSSARQNMSHLAPSPPSDAKSPSEDGRSLIERQFSKNISGTRKSRQRPLSAMARLTPQTVRGGGRAPILLSAMISQKQEQSKESSDEAVLASTELLPLPDVLCSANVESCRYCV